MIHLPLEFRAERGGPRGPDAHRGGGAPAARCGARWCCRCAASVERSACWAARWAARSGWGSSCCRCRPARPSSTPRPRRDWMSCAPRSPNGRRCGWCTVAPGPRTIRRWRSRCWPSARGRRAARAGGGRLLPEAPHPRRAGRARAAAWASSRATTRSSCAARWRRQLVEGATRLASRRADAARAALLGMGLAERLEIGATESGNAGREPRWPRRVVEADGDADR